ncbi:HNH endonuclease [Nostocaceae cyanobacterium CENA369]|uniref:HNH endonuclease n=1 Tax=Dendronalium phyllosphericum CENA369 TaxID=1725256 RepID=A0A8J7I6C8_9NOST|nr:HNH endonuclease signature motif containing protein [Dendronalium phyllosphericum]MBH8573936.1 HNH endonuclease [Dendronalium phyllosphericum CENA369]
MEKLISEQKTPRTWLLLSFGDQRQYGGNLGYEDEISKVYQYDNKVPNYKQVTEGDLVLLRDKEQLLGIAQIELIKSSPGIKELLRCPSCRTTRFNKPKKKPIFHCPRCGYDFDIPLTEPKECKKFTAYFGDTFVAAEGAIELKVLQQACPRYNIQLSINSIDLQQIQATLLKNTPAVAKLINKNNYSKYLQGDEASEYVPVTEDRRETVFRQIKERRGQSKFRDLLRQRYGAQCMITGLKLLDVLEAAHISPYRGTDDNHPDNGLLLRADLHTLFDLNLLGINPESLEVKFHPKVLKAGYQKLDGRKLICSRYQPSQSALLSRWKQFLNGLNEDD